VEIIRERVEMGKFGGVWLLFPLSSKIDIHYLYICNILELARVKTRRNGKTFVGYKGVLTSEWI
jgi:hypothetical protein